MSDYESALLETWQRKPDAIPVLLSDNLRKEREIAALREQLATTASDGEQMCSACEQLGQVPTPDHLASVAAFSADVAQVVEVSLLRERVTELAEANDAMERERDAMQAERDELVAACKDWADTSRQVLAAHDAMGAERDAMQARAERAEAALRRSKRWLEGAEETFAASMDCGEEAYQSAEDCILGDSYCERARDMQRGIAEIDAALAAAPEARR